MTTDYREADHPGPVNSLARAAPRRHRARSAQTALAQPTSAVCPLAVVDSGEADHGRSLSTMAQHRGRAGSEQG
jgi:hypothetical protein